MGLLSDLYDVGASDDEEISQPAPVSSNPNEPARIVIAGGGIVGLVLALAVKKHLNIIPEIYEKSHGFYDDVGAGLGCYPNGLRVIRDIDPALLQKIQDAGFPYLFRRWERHDGTEIAAADESELTEGEEELASTGIRRWKLQKVLYEAVVDAAIPIYWEKATRDVILLEDDLVEVVFVDGTRRKTELLFGCDGAHSQVRTVMVGNATQFEYTGITCLMGIAECPRKQRGICFPSSHTTACHATFFPTGPDEQCFQFHWTVPKEESDTQCWGNLSNAMTRDECRKLAERLRKDGWDEKYIAPLSHVTHAVRVGFALLNPPLKQWAFGKNKRVILVGDAAHPPVPYIGQGAQMGLEDAGTITWLLKKLCVNHKGKFSYKNFEKAVEIYESLRIPRSGEVLDCSKQLGSLEELRGNEKAREELEHMIQGDLMMHGTLPIMFQGAAHDYKDATMRKIKTYESRMEKDAFDQLFQGIVDTSPEAEHAKEVEEAEQIRRAYEILLNAGARE